MSSSEVTAAAEPRPERIQPPVPPAAPRPSAALRRRRVPLRARLRRDWRMLVMITPGFLILLIFSYIPIAGNVSPPSSREARSRGTA